MDTRTIDELLTAAEAAHRREVTELEQFAGVGNSPRDLSGELDDVGQHPGDAASETTEREVDLGLLEDARSVLAEIAAARQRLVAGTYGLCETCDEPIADDRLEAVPWARRCRDHQAHLERSGSWLTNDAAGAMGGPDDVTTASIDPMWDPEDDDQSMSAEESAMHEIEESAP
jgi:RNA polymerase-binding transcription factor DksA